MGTDPNDAGGCEDCDDANATGGGDRRGPGEQDGLEPHDLGDGDTAGGGDTGGGLDTGGGTDSGEDQGAPDLPSQVLDLANWKLTLPLPDKDGGGPLEVAQPELAEFEVDPWFLAEGDHVRFRAHAGGATTSGSHYPRSELREMTADGAEKASWSTTEGVHTLTIVQAITHLPVAKPQVVAGQIHDAADDVVMIRLEGSRLFVEGGGEDLGELDADYVLGDLFTVRIEAGDGRIDVTYGDDAGPAVSVPADAEGCYFKAGVYTQSNPERGDDPDAYGEVELHDLQVTHR